MKKIFRYILLLFCMAFPLNFHALPKPEILFSQRQEHNWSLGVFFGAGPGIAQSRLALDGERASLFPENTYETQTTLGWNFGVAAQYFLSEESALVARGFYDSRNIRYEKKDPVNQYERSGTYQLSFLSADLGVRYFYYFFFVGGGFSMGIPLGGTETGQETFSGFAGKYYQQSISATQMKFQWGLLLEAGTDFRFGKRSSFTLALRYHWYPPFAYQQNTTLNSSNAKDDTTLQAARIHPLTLNAEMNFYY